MRFDTIWYISSIDTSSPVDTILRKEEIVKLNIILSDHEIKTIKMATGNTRKYKLICDELKGGDKDGDRPAIHVNINWYVMNLKMGCDPHDEMTFLL